MSNRRGQRQRGRVGGSINNKLMDWSVGGTFTRASTGYYRTGGTESSPTSTASVGSNVRRFQNGRILLEGSRTGTSRYSEDLTNAVWTKFNCTVSSTITAPDGTNTADVITVTSTGLACFVSETPPTAPTANLSVSFWVIDPDGVGYTGSYTISSGVSTSADFTVTGSWSRIEINIAPAAAYTLNIRPHAGAGTGTAGRRMGIWGVHCENQPFATSYIPTTSANATRAADSLTYSSGSWNTRLATNNFCIEWAPTGPSTGYSVGVDILSFGGANDRLSISNVDSMQVVVGGVLFAASSALTWNRDSVLTVTVRPTTGVCTVSGALTGNGNFGSTPWSWPTAVTLRVGGRVGSTAEINGCISNPVAV